MITFLFREHGLDVLLLQTVSNVNKRASKVRNSYYYIFTLVSKLYTVVGQLKAFVLVDRQAKYEYNTKDDKQK